MTTPTTQRRTRLRPHGRAEAGLNRLHRLLAAAAAYAAAELLLVLALGFLGWGRAEALPFLALRPWLLLAAAALAARLDWRERSLFYGSALLLAATSQSLFLLGLGASNPWPEAGRGLAAGAALVLAADLLVQLGLRVGKIYGRLAATILLACLFVAGALAPYEALVTGPGETQAADKRDLMVMTALPLRWSEQGPLDPNGRPAAAYRALADEFSMRFLDRLDPSVLSSGRLLLLAQPRALDPAELVALDSWVRSGGRALILTDPALHWPSELPLGDIRRAPAIGLLDPLLRHWGLVLGSDAEARLATEHVVTAGGERRLIMFAPGRFVSQGKDCATGPIAALARCRLGRGQALLLADADTIHDRLWLGPGPRGGERHARRSDNVLILADWLDQLAGDRRVRKAGPVQWLKPEADPMIALLIALLPLLALAVMIAILRFSRR